MTLNQIYGIYKYISKKYCREIACTIDIILRTKKNWEFF